MVPYNTGKGYIALKNILITAHATAYTHNYFFLWVAQNFDLPEAEFLQGFPSLVFAAHFTFFATAMFKFPLLKIVLTAMH